MSPSSPAAEIAARPEWLPEALWDEKGVKLDALKDPFERLAQIDATAAERAKDIPGDAAEYGLPTDAKLPEGWKLDDKDVRWASLRDMAKAEGWTRKEFGERASQFVAMDVAFRQHQQQLFDQGIAARDAALGDKATQRIDAVKTFLAGTFTPAEAENVSHVLVTPEIIGVFEKIAAVFANQGVTSLNGTGREAGDQKPEGWEKMTFEQKWSTAVPSRRAS